MHGRLKVGERPGVASVCSRVTIQMTTGALPKARVRRCGRRDGGWSNGDPVGTATGWRRRWRHALRTEHPAHTMRSRCRCGHGTSR